MTRGFGAIYVSGPGGVLTLLPGEPYENEASLQQLIANHPYLLGGDQIDDDERRWLLVRREMIVEDAGTGAARWAVDHLFLDQDGVPTLVEVKRAADTRTRREVVGQMLDYAANATAYWSVEAIRGALQTRGLDADTAVQELSDRSAAEYWRLVQDNIDARRVRLMFVADRIPRELLRIVEYPNDQMDKTEVLAVEVRRYASNGVLAYAPRVLGRTAASADKKSGGASRNYADSTDFNGVLAKCAKEGDNVLIGFEGGIERLRAMSAADLRARYSYKWDKAVGGSGAKKRSNWLPGTVFLTICKEKGLLTPDPADGLVPAHTDVTNATPGL